jgi:hypothetical protein
MRLPDMVLQAIEQVNEDENYDFDALSQDKNWQLTTSGEFCPYVSSNHTKLTR